MIFVRLYSGGNA